MSDPRERIETENLEATVLFLEGQTVDKTAYWWLGLRDPHEGAAPWPEVVAFARAILAADEEWLDSQTPTLEELRAKYDGKWHMSARRHGLCFEAEIMPHGSVSNPTYCDGFDTEKQAIRWLVDVIEDRGAFAEITPVGAGRN